MSRSPLPAPLQPALRETPGAVPPDDAIRLAQYAARLRARLWWPIGGMAVGVAAGLGLFLLTPKTYEGLATLKVAASKSADSGSGRDTTLDYAGLLANRTLAADVIKALDLRQPGLTPTTFIRTHLTVEPVPNAALLRVRVRLADPALAARATNMMAERGIELARRLSTEESAIARDRLKTQVDEARTQLDAAQQAHEAFNAASQIDLARRDANAILDQRGELLSIFVELQGAKARLAEAEADLAKRQRLDILRRAIGSDAEALAPPATPAAPGAEPAGELVVQEVNRVYERLDEETAYTRIRVAALERQWNELVRVRKVDAPQSATLARFYALESTHKRLTLERELAETIYKEVAATYEKARMRVETGSAVLQLVDAAVRPDRHVSPRRSVNAAIGLTVGGLAGLLAALAIRRRDGAAA